MPSGGKPCHSGSQYSKQEKETCEEGKDLVKVVWFAEAVERLHQNSPTEAPLRFARMSLRSVPRLVWALSNSVYRRQRRRGLPGLRRKEFRINLGAPLVVCLNAV